MPCHEHSFHLHSCPGHRLGRHRRPLRVALISRQTDDTSTHNAQRANLRCFSLFVLVFVLVLPLPLDFFLLASFVFLQHCLQHPCQKSFVSALTCFVSFQTKHSSFADLPD
jgi:hypothetical protein